ncbi:MAG: 3-hydroxyacyl-ACP dehydratase FabZ family protein [Thermodesulfovibrionales bacterium]
MRYLLVDHIIEWKAGESIRGIKNVAMSEDFLEFHFPKNPIMPGVMLLEALTQLTGWLEAASSDFRQWFLISGVNKCSFYGFAFPGDQVELRVEFVSSSAENRKVFKGTGLVQGKKKIAVEFEGSLVPFDELEDGEEQRRFFDLLMRNLGL